MGKLCLKIINYKILCFLIVILIQIFFISNIQAEDLPKIKKVELFQDKDSSRVFISLTKPIDKLPLVMATLKTVLFDLDAVCKTKQERRNRKHEDREGNKPEIVSGGFVDKVMWRQVLDKTSFEIKRKYYTPVSVVKKDKPDVIVVELERNYFKKESWELKPGITKHLIRAENSRGPVAANVLEIDLANKDISVKVGLPHKEKLKTKDKLTNIVKNEMAYAGINANYFDVKIGNPLGLLITSGELVVGPIYDRVAIGFTDDKKTLVDCLMLTGIVTVSRGFRKKEVSTFDIDGFNTPFHLYNMAGLFNSKWDEKLELGENIQGTVLKKNCVKKLVKEKSEIPKDGYVLALKDKGLLKKRDCLKIAWQMEPDWSEVKEAISGGPYLIMNGEVYIDDEKEHFKFAKKDTYAPRTAIGIGKNEKLYLIAVDGRNNGYSVGLTLTELAEFLNKLDLKDAINLDGGGSTELVVDGKIINKLNEHHERKISSALLIFYK